MKAPPEKLTSYPPASLREVAALSFPFILVLFSGSLMAFIDRLILARYSLEAVEASLSAFYLLQLFQIPCVRIASTAQIFVAQYRGSKELSNIGPVVWQMIWFSFFSLLFLTPLGWPIGSWFFQNTSVHELAQPYFHCLMAANALFPLSAALASFYLGQGQTKKVLVASILSHLTHVLLDFPLIFGIKGVLPPLGAQGTAFALVIAQLLFCALLMRHFLKPSNRIIFGTHQWRFQWDLFWSSIRIGLPRAGGKIAHLTAWTAITHVIITKEGNYLAILAFGGTFNLFYTCVNEGISQSLVTIGGFLIGARQFLLWRLAKSAFLFLAIWAALLGIPCLLFPDSLIALFFDQPPSHALHHELILTCYWLGLLFVMHGSNLIALGLLNAYGDTMYQMICSTASAWITSFLPVYFFIGRLNSSPHRLWLIMAITCLIAALLYFFRLSKEKWREISFEKSPLPLSQQSPV